MENVQTAMLKAIALEKILKLYHAGFADKMTTEFRFQKCFGLEKGMWLLANYSSGEALIKNLDEKQLSNFIKQF